MIEIEGSVTKPVEEQRVEIVERKGLGHPDYIADSLAEAFSWDLVESYLKKYGDIMHYNVDKLDVVGGVSQTGFMGGEMIKPVLVFFSGRATNPGIDLEDIAINSAKKWIKQNLRFLDPREIRYLVETKKGSANLTDIYKREFIGANDTSIGIGYAPLSNVEKKVLEIENFLNSKKFKKKFPHAGEDVKVMGIRKNCFVLGDAVKYNLLVA